MSNEARITIRRGITFADRLRAYNVTIDGTVVASVRAGKSVTVSVPSGQHTVALRIDWCGSEAVPFEAREGEHLTFECGNNLPGWRLFLSIFYILFRQQEYLVLRRVP